MISMKRELTDQGFSFYTIFLGLFLVYWLSCRSQEVSFGVGVDSLTYIYILYATPSVGLCSLKTCYLRTPPYTSGGMQVSKNSKVILLSSYPPIRWTR